MAIDITEFTRAPRAAYGKVIKCDFCENPSENTVCDSCLLKIVSQKDDFLDLLFLVSELVTAPNLSGISETLLLLGEVFNRLRDKCRNQQPITSLRTATELFRQDYIKRVLGECKNHTEAASVLGICRTYLSRLLRDRELK